MLVTLCIAALATSPLRQKVFLPSAPPPAVPLPRLKAIYRQNKSKSTGSKMESGTGVDLLAVVPRHHTFLCRHLGDDI